MKKNKSLAAEVSSLKQQLADNTKSVLKELQEKQRLLELEEKERLLANIPQEVIDRYNGRPVQQFINSLSNGEKAELFGKTIKNVYGVLHKALNQAVENEFITHNPASACKLPKVKKPPIHPLEPEEITKFITEALKDDYGNMFIVAIFAGIRQGELLGLPWENVDFERMTITIDRQLQKNKEGYFFCTPKNGTSRSFAVAPVVMEALKKEKEKQENLRSLLGEEWNNEHNLVFTTDYGKNLVRRTVVKHYKKVLERAGLPDNRFHDLRHSFAVNSLAVGDNIKMYSRIWDMRLLLLPWMFTVMYPRQWPGKVRQKHRNFTKA